MDDIYVFYYRVEYLDGIAKGAISEDVNKDVYSATDDDDAVKQVQLFLKLVEGPGFLKIHPIEKDPLRHERSVPFAR